MLPLSVFQISIQKELNLKNTDVLLLHLIHIQNIPKTPSKVINKQPNAKSTNCLNLQISKIINIPYFISISQFAVFN